MALVVALAKLHNFCIASNDNCDTSYNAADEWNMELNGAVPLVPVGEVENNIDNGIPRQLLDGGEHFDDIGGTVGGRNRQRRYYNREEDCVMPRDRLHSQVELMGLVRPTPVAQQQRRV